MKRLLLALALLLGQLPSLALAEESDQDRAREAVERGASVPLEAALDKVRAEHPGKVLRVELEEEGGRLIYEIRLLAPGGRIEQWRYDAQSLAAVPGRSDADRAAHEKDE